MAKKSSSIGRVIKRIIEKHKRVKFIHFLTHMMGKLLLGLGVGAYFFDHLRPYVFALIIVGAALHFPFWKHVYLDN